MKRTLGMSIENLLEHPDVRRTERDGRTLYVAADIVAALVDSAHPGEYWEDLKQLEPALARWVETTATRASRWTRSTLTACYAWSSRSPRRARSD